MGRSESYLGACHESFQLYATKIAHCFAVFASTFLSVVSYPFIILQFIERTGVSLNNNCLVASRAKA